MQLDKTTPWGFIAGIVWGSICLIGVVVLAVVHDGQLSNTAMTILQNILIAIVGGTTVWGTTHSIVTARAASAPSQALPAASSEAS